jgi:hypothetical protein
VLELAGLYLRRLGSVISSGEGGRQAEAIDVPGHQSGQSSYASRGGWSSVLWAKMGGIGIAWSRFEGEERAVFGEPSLANDNVTKGRVCTEGAM